MNDAVKFFYEHAGYSYGPGETPEQGRVRCAESLAAAEQRAKDRGYTFEWEVDPDIDSSEFSDEGPAWPLYGCIMKDADGTVRGSLWAIDLGRDAEYWSGQRFSDEPYVRVVQAEIASEEIPENADDAPLSDARALDMIADMATRGLRTYKVDEITSIIKRTGRA